MEDFLNEISEDFIQYSTKFTLTENNFLTVSTLNFTKNHLEKTSKTMSKWKICLPWWEVHNTKRSTLPARPKNWTCSKIQQSSLTKNRVKTVSWCSRGHAKTSLRRTFQFSWMMRSSAFKAKSIFLWYCR